MEPANLLSLNELRYYCVQSSHNYCSIKQELIETKRKLVLLEERLNQLEEQNKVVYTTPLIRSYGSELINIKHETISIIDNDISGP